MDTAPAARRLAIRRVPLDALHLDPANARATPSGPGGPGLRSRAMVDVECPTCGEQRRIRRDSFADAPPRCRRCSNRSNGARTVHRRRGTWVACGHCGVRLYRPPCESTKRYCSAECANLSRRRYQRQERSCRGCGSSFTFVPKPHSNSTGDYCSRACRYNGALGLIHYDPDRPAAGERRGWRSRRNAFVRNHNSFCVLCGQREGRLHVHHIEGFRNTPYDDLSTVVTVCPRHHRRLEVVTERLQRCTPSVRRRTALLVKAALGDSWCVHAGRALAEGGASCN